MSKTSVPDIQKVLIFLGKHAPGPLTLFDKTRTILIIWISYHLVHQLFSRWFKATIFHVITYLYITLNSSTIDELGEGAWKRWWGLEHRSRARRVTMTTLWAATTRHRHTDKRQWNHDTYHILTGKRGREGRGVKSPSTVEKAKVHVQMSWPQNPSCKTTRPPADPPPLRMTETRETPDQHCFAFNLA